jgi:RNA-directed DNA polymerase
MKRTGHLFEEFCSFDNLYLASQKAQKGKKYKYATAAFNFEIEKNLLKIQKKLLEHNYQFGNYASFYVHDPKKRYISAAPYEDRVVHHAICNILEPIFEKVFIYDIYANRKNKGTHKAVQRYIKFCRLNKYVLKCDIKKYFQSIDKAILFSLIEAKIKDKKFLAVLKKVIDSFTFPGSSTQGIPLGNLTSQIFANIYLNKMDHFIKEQLGCCYYLRYVDDFVIFDNAKDRLHLLKKEIQKFLEEYKLELHTKKTQVRKVSEGIKFLGYRIWPDYLLVNKENVKRFKRKLKKFQKLYREDKISFQEIKQSVLSWIAHAKWANSYLLRKEIFDYYVFSRG